MIEVKAGTIITATNIKAGQGKNGVWAFGRVYAENGKSSITVWFDNPDDYKDLHDFKVKSIVSAKKTARKVEKDGTTKWYDEYAVNAIMEKVDDPAPEGFSKLDEDVPF